jgi:hypothetical protein
MTDGGAQTAWLCVSSAAQSVTHVSARASRGGLDTDCMSTALIHRTSALTGVPPAAFGESSQALLASLIQTAWTPPFVTDYSGSRVKWGQ